MAHRHDVLGPAEVREQPPQHHENEDTKDHGDYNVVNVAHFLYAKQMTSACILDLIQQPKPLKESCFSEKQIDLLFNEWRKWMYEHFRTAYGSFGASGQDQAWEQVDALYSSAISVQQKYDALRFNTASGLSGHVALATHESEWVLDDGPPSPNQTFGPFVAYIRSQLELMAELRMSFKPKLNHSGPLELTDFVAVLLRYVYWLRDTKASLNVIGVSDRDSSTSVEAMVDALKNQWAYDRYHLAVLYNNNAYVSVLIDKVDGTFDYYDPLGVPLQLNDESNELAQQVLELFNTATALDAKLMERRDMLAQGMSKVRRGFQPSPSKVDCGMFILLFVHLRVVEHHSMDQIASLDVTHEKCEALKPRFFTIPDVLKTPDSNLSMRYGAYDVRLAAWNFVVYVEQMLLQLVSEQSRAAVKQRVDLVKRLCIEPGDYNQIRFVCVELQSDLIKSLPNTYLSYSGTNLWIPYLNQVVNDPLTKHLRGTDRKSKTKAHKGPRGPTGHRSRSTVRRTELAALYDRIMEWTKTPVNASDVVSVQNVLTNIITQYLMLLNFDKPAKPEFVTEMAASPIGFLVETSRRQETVSFGVSLLRQMNDIVRKHFVGLSTLGTDLDKYKQPEVPEVHSQEELKKLEQVMTKCDQALKRAYEIIKESMHDQLTVIPGRPMITPLGNGMMAMATPLGPFGQRSSGPLGPTGANDLIGKMFIADRLAVWSNDQVQPWTFPIIVTEFVSRYGSPSSDYLVTTTSKDIIQQLASNSSYMDAYIRGLGKLQWSQLSDTNFTTVCDSMAELWSWTSRPYKSTLAQQAQAVRRFMMQSSNRFSNVSQVLERLTVMT